MAKQASPSFKSSGEDGPGYPGGAGGEDWCKPKIRSSQALANPALALQSKLESLRTQRLKKAQIVAPETIQATVNQVRKHPKILVP